MLNVMYEYLAVNLDRFELVQPMNLGHYRPPELPVQLRGSKRVGWLWSGMT